MQLIVRLYVFTILWLGSLAAPLSHDESTKRNFVGNGQHPQLDSVTVNSKISTLDETTHHKTETPFLTVSADAMNNPEIISIQLTSATLSEKPGKALSSDSPASVTRATQTQSQTLVEPLRTASISDAYPVLALPTIKTPAGTGGRAQSTQQVEPFRSSSSFGAFPVLALPTVEPLTSSGTGERSESTLPAKSSGTSSSFDAFAVVALPTVESITGTDESTKTILQTNPFGTVSTSDADAFTVIAFPTVAEPVSTAVPSNGSPEHVVSPPPMQADDRGWGWPWGGCVVC